MSITASQVKELRERTGAGMMECKKALTESNGDIEAAITAMRKKGSLKAAKRAGKTAAEGAIIIKRNDDMKQAVMVEINCETDFVAKDANFVKFADEVGAVALANQVTDIETLSGLDLNGETVDARRTSLIAEIGENIQIRRLADMASSGVVGAYKHGAKIGVLVGLDVADEALAKDIAMHIAATIPQAIDSNGVPADVVAKERDIFLAQAGNSGKPPEIAEKMVEGRIKKFLKEVSLVDQPFVKDPSKTVGDLLKAANAKVLGFARYEVGEGIEKEQGDFAAEVMAQVKGE